jgi:hypothetical protein
VTPSRRSSAAVVAAATPRDAACPTGTRRSARGSSGRRGGPGHPDDRGGAHARPRHAPRALIHARRWTIRAQTRTTGGRAAPGELEGLVDRMVREVRVLLGALEKPRRRGAFLLRGRISSSHRRAPLATAWRHTARTREPGWRRSSAATTDRGALAVRLSRLPRPPDQSPRVRQQTRRPPRTRTPRGQRPSRRGSDVA